ncbi:PREDICTED: alpha-tectorin-like [Nanorana parkeri]|uniref:alpha-tectorin-like n=1 Tax=Nanorana parkeri TaxID=125878 RepID=UPI0008547C1D|nr:PREDICTED: alpha-tectorin-like [Nanorana parkeri]
MKSVPLLLVVLIAIVGHGSGFSDSSQEHQQNQVPAQEDQLLYGDDDDLLYPFGKEQGDKATPVEDDGCSEQEHLQEEFNFFGKSYKCLYVCNNGLVSFNTPVSQYTPDAFPLTEGQKFIAPFWGDSDIDLGGDVHHRETKDPRILQRITDDMAKHLPSLHYKAKWAYIVTWYEMVFYGAAVKKRNTFQAVLTSDGYQYFVIMNYKKIEWTTGTASEGDPDTGLGGTPAQAGFNSGDEINYFNIPGSRTNEVLKITSTSNVNYPGRWIFQVDHLDAPGGCIFQAKFASEGVPFWKESTCSTKCLCQGKTVTCVSEVCPPSSTCELLGSFFTCKVQKEPEQEPEKEPEQEPEQEPEKTCL